MQGTQSAEPPSFFARLGMAWRLIVDGLFAGQVAAGLKALENQPKPEESKRPRPQADASGLFVLAAMQREGRLIDFLQQEVAGFSDEEVGGAARIVHTGCRKVLREYFALSPAVEGDEGATMTVPPGFDAQRIRLTGNITGQPPFKGTVKHHGWVAKEVRLPALSDGLDLRVVAPAEIDLP